MAGAGISPNTPIPSTRDIVSTYFKLRFSNFGSWTPPSLLNGPNTYDNLPFLNQMALYAEKFREYIEKSVEDYECNPSHIPPNVVDEMKLFLVNLIYYYGDNWTSYCTAIVYAGEAIVRFVKNGHQSAADEKVKEVVDLTTEVVNAEGREEWIDNHYSGWLDCDWTEPTDHPNM